MPPSAERIHEVDSPIGALMLALMTVRDLRANVLARFNR
jgi:hypothetical protein